MATANRNDLLEEVLILLGDRDDLPAHHRSNLLHAIQLFAGVTGNEGLSWACEARINLIRCESRN